MPPHACLFPAACIPLLVPTETPRCCSAVCPSALVPCSTLVASLTQLRSRSVLQATACSTACSSSGVQKRIHVIHWVGRRCTNQTREVLYENLFCSGERLADLFCDVIGGHTVTSRREAFWLGNTARLVMRTPATQTKSKVVSRPTGSD